MSALSNPYDIVLEGLLENGVTVSPALAQEIADWGINYLQTATGITLVGRSEISASEIEQITAYFQDPANAIAYASAAASSSWYPAYLQALAGIDIGAGEGPGSGTGDTDDGPDDNPLPPQVDEWLAFMNSAEGLESLTRLWVAFYDQLPDSGVFNQLLSNFAEAGSLSAIASAIAGNSPLLSGSVSLDDASFVAQAYEHILDRQAESEGLNYWLEQLQNGLDREALVLSFSSSSEFSELIGASVERQLDKLGLVDDGTLDNEAFSVGRYYYGVFDREPDIEGLKYWAQKQAQGEDLNDIVSAMMASDEFTSQFSDTTDTEFVEALYQRALDRESDAPGLQYWVGALEGGVSRSAVINSFIESPEFETLTDNSTLLDIVGQAAQAYPDLFA